jgi:hypothetical protein
MKVGEPFISIDERPPAKSMSGALASMTPYGVSEMITDRPQNDVRSPARRLARHALSLTRVSIVAMAAALMPVTLGGWHTPIATNAAFAQGSNSGRISGPRIGGIPVLPGMPGSSNLGGLPGAAGTAGTFGMSGSNGQGRLMSNPGSMMMSSPGSSTITNPGGVGAPDSTGRVGGVGGVGNGLINSTGSSSMGQ